MTTPTKPPTDKSTWKHLLDHLPDAAPADMAAVATPAGYDTFATWVRLFTAAYVAKSAKPTPAKRATKKAAAKEVAPVPATAGMPGTARSREVTTMFKEPKAAKK